MKKHLLSFFYIFVQHNIIHYKNTSIELIKSVGCISLYTAISTLIGFNRGVKTQGEDHLVEGESISLST